MAEPERLPDRVARLIGENPKEIAFSAVSAWEIAIKTSLGKLEGVPVDSLSDEVAAQGWHELPLSLRHVPVIAQLPFHHHDPFDRALVGQAMVEDLALLSADPKIARYEIEVIW